LITAHAVSRAILPVTMWALPPARDDGLGADAGRPRFARIIAGLAIALAIAATALGPLRAAIAVAVAAIAVAAAGVTALRRVGGYTGDVLGAVQQVAEVTILLGACAVR
jgi:adenosylcobinamide-GDP ribazoletransferase